MTSRLDALFRRTNRVAAGTIKFDLERMRQMLASAGQPERGVPTVLIAGTNGKGSLTAMWARALAHEGHTVGCYTSPHLVRFHERIAVNGVPIDDDALAAVLAALAEHEARVGIELTFFEATTFMAFLHYRNAGATALVLEVGMGGRLDATNASAPSLSLITTIGRDHMEHLGESEGEIAREKAGVMRPGVTTVAGDLSAAALGAVRAAATAIGARLVELGDARDHVACGERQMAVPSPAMFGAHQRHNAALFTLSALAAAGTDVALSEAAIGAGVRAIVPGRYEVREAGGVRFVIDGAHNGPAMVALRAAILADPAFTAPRTLIFGGTQGRALAETVLAVSDLFVHVIVCEPPTERAIPIAEMQQAVPRARAAGSVREAIAIARTLGANVCVTGSLYLVGETLAVLDGGARDAVSDYR
ncbi:MAG: bifunctional folylpolyglutamate synthase/dihydrofolate synthase [Deltaproteobacteria bacterium]|nr:bifunctional folylpolyglutamate synthase/dihydrofolate synthase [Deltaproteobacteria bacterium]